MIKSFKPFLSIETFDDVSFRIVFKCPHCGSNSCVKLGDLDKLSFWSGVYMCSSCGMSSSHGKEFNYYHDCFIRISKPSSPIQLSLDFV